ncbi:MAG TPA: MFS transporter [Myxococcales bacterium]|nr:MFS transporter [Myxococcales bacterium]
MRDPARRTRARVFALTWLSYASYYLARKNFSVAKKTIELELGIGRQALGWIDTGFLAAYAVGQFVFGRVTDRAGAKRVLVAGMLATAACTWWFGLSSSAAMMALAFGLNGLAQSTGWSANVKTMAHWVGPQRRGLVMGVWSTCYQVGSLVANPVCTAFLVALGWRAAFFYPPLEVVAVALLLAGLLPPPPGADPPAPAAAAAAEPEPAPAPAPARSVLRNPLLWALGTSYFFMKLIRYVLLFWLPYFMQDSLGYSKALAGNVPLAFEAGGAVGSLLVGWLSDRAFRGQRVKVGVGALVGLAAALAAYSVLAGRGVVANALALAAVGFFLFGPDSLLSGAAAQDLGGPREAGTAAGVINGIGSVGSVFSGLLAAWCSARFGWGTLYLLLGGGALVAAAILLPFVRLSSRPWNG